MCIFYRPYSTIIAKDKNNKNKSITYNASQRYPAGLIGYCMQPHLVPR